METPETLDVEKNAGSDYAHLTNTTIQSFSWDNVAVTVKDRETKLPKDILSGINGIVKAGQSLRTHIQYLQCKTDISIIGELLALMGPR